MIKLTTIKSNPNNPRVIRDEKFKKLVKSIEEFPKMMALRPMVVNEDMVVLGGNMRLKALKELGYKEVPDEWIKSAKDLTDDEIRRFIIADNVGFGEHDWELLANEWDAAELADWGLDIPGFDNIELSENDDTIDDTYTKKVEAPIYEPGEEKPTLNELFDDSFAKKLIEDIENSTLDKKDKDFLKLAAFRHVVFNYHKIADFYAHSNKEVQTLMENSALVIIDFDKAIELGYVKISEELLSNFEEEYPDEQ